MWSLWGMGSLNTAVLPATVLSTARRYRVPAVVRAIATDLPDEWDGRQVYRGEYRLHHDLLERALRVRRARVADARRDAVERPGLPVRAARPAGAHLGRHAVARGAGVRHNPAADSNSSSARPNGWAGQRVLPRARQHRGTVIALHRVRADPPVVPDAADGRVAAIRPVARRTGRRRVRRSGGRRRVRTGARRRGGRAGVDSARRRPARTSTTVGRAAVHGSFGEFVAALARAGVRGRPLGRPAGRVDGSATAARSTCRGRARSSSTAAPPTSTVTAVPDSRSISRTPRVTSAFGDSRLVAEWCGERLELDLTSGRRVDPPSSVCVHVRSRRTRDLSSDAGAGNAVKGLDLTPASLAEPALAPLDPTMLTRERLTELGQRIVARTWEHGLPTWSWGEAVALIGMVRFAARHRRARPDRRDRMARRAHARRRHDRSRQRCRPGHRRRAHRSRRRLHAVPRRVRLAVGGWRRRRPPPRAPRPARRTARSSTGRAACGPTPCSWPACSSATSAWRRAGRTGSTSSAANSSPTPRCCRHRAGCSPTARTTARRSRATGDGPTRGVPSPPSSSSSWPTLSGMADAAPRPTGRRQPSPPARRTGRPPARPRRLERAGRRPAGVRRDRRDVGGGGDRRRDAPRLPPSSPTSRSRHRERLARRPRRARLRRRCRDADPHVGRHGAATDPIRLQRDPRRPTPALGSGLVAACGRRRAGGRPVTATARALRRRAARRAQPGSR